MAKTDRMDKNKYSVVFFLRDKPKKQRHSKAEGKKKKTSQSSEHSDLLNHRGSPRQHDPVVNRHRHCHHGLRT